MLELAIRAETPIITVSYTDISNVAAVLKHISGHIFKPFDAKNTLAHKYTYCVGTSGGISLQGLYPKLTHKGFVLVIVNPVDATPDVLNLGVLETPMAFIEELLLQVLDVEMVPSIVGHLHGLSIKQVNEVLRITSTRDGSITPEGISSIRRALYPAPEKGLVTVDTGFDFYYPNEQVDAWLAVDGKYFMDRRYSALVPRGLIMAGAAGTGKTMAAKVIAKEVGVPLFLLDMGTMLGKYVGASESNLNAALARVEHESPCVILLDEVEKLFKSGDDGGVQSRLLGQLLWWLQEHTSPVLTLMTTNDISIIPEELYRAGRIDSIMEFSRVKHPQMFAKNLIASMGILNKGQAAEIYNGICEVTPATITQEVYAETKVILLGTLEA